MGALGEMAVGALEIQEAEADLLEVVRALCPSGGLTSALHRRQQQGDQDPDVGTFDAVWYDVRGTTEAGPSITRTWFSEEVPGKVLRSETRVEGSDKLTTLELVEFEKP